MSIWRIQSTTPDGSLNTSWEKVSAARRASFKKRHTHEASVRWREKRREVRLRERPSALLQGCCRNKTTTEFFNGPQDASYLMESALSSCCTTLHSRPKLVSIQHIPTESLNYTLILQTAWGGCPQRTSRLRLRLTFITQRRSDCSDLLQWRHPPE